MKRPSIASCLLSLLLVVQVTAGSAQEVSKTGIAHKTSVDGDVDAIERTIRAQFDRPESPLTIQPVTVQGDFAIAGWHQGQRGGRALLHRLNGAWSIELCGGRGLREADAIAKAGLPAPAAEILASKVRDAEARLPPEQRASLDLFGATVNVNAGSPHHQ